jgi:hypothetical protein
VVRDNLIVRTALQNRVCVEIPIHRAIRETMDRVRTLFDDAIIADEPYSITSAVDLNMFLRSLSITQRPSIFLLDNGNLQTVWRNTNKEQISHQFFGGNVVQFAMFACRPGMPMARIAGQDCADRVRAKVIEHGCQHLIV